MSDRPEVFVHLLPTLIPPGALKGGIAVVVDVLRATTMMVHALAAGCEAVIPCGEIDEARRIAASLPPGSALLGGERGGLPIEGFDLGNSPSSCSPEVCRGKTLVMTTTNGTRAILASLEAERVIIGAFVNLRATVQLLAVNLLRAHVRPLHIVCAGTDGQISLEDALLAGALVFNLSPSLRLAGDEIDSSLDLLPEVEPGNDEAIMVASMWHGTPHAKSHGVLLGLSLRRGRGGANLLALGMGADIQDAARVDRFDLAAELVRDPLRIVSTQ